jgi:prolyl oligopeptidase
MKDASTETLAARGAGAEMFHGVAVPDVHGWLDDIADASVTAWLAAQEDETSTVLAGLRTGQDLRPRVAELRGHRRASIPLHVGGRTFQTRAVGLQEQPILYVSDDQHATATRPLIDVNQIDPSGLVALTGWEVDPTATLVAYALSTGGSDLQTIRVRSVETGTDLPDVVRQVKSEEDLPFPNVSWAPDGSGFFYSRLPFLDSIEPDQRYRSSQVWWHRIGSDQEKDELVLAKPEDPELNFVPIVSQDGRHLVLHAWRGLSGKHMVLVGPVDRRGGFLPLIAVADARYLFLGSDGDRFFFHTNAEAPRGRVIAIDLHRPERENWVDIIPEEVRPIARAYHAGRHVAAVLVHDSHHEIAIYATDGQRGPAIALPAGGTVSDVAVDGDRLMVLFESFFRPKGVLAYDLSSGKLVSDETAGIPFDPTPYVIDQEFVTVADGARIPVTLVRRHDARPAEQRPLLLYGYGGFNVSETPVFDPVVLHWLERDGTYALANPRGGGEYGEAWHEAGRRHAKQVVFDDFQAVAEWLIAQGLTTHETLAIRGESNGGLLTAACMLQRPDLYGAVVSSLPVTDMLRFPRYTIGFYWTHEYGNAEASVDDFDVLRRYSPLENVGAGVDYPPVLVTTGDGDDRVVPSHAMKLVAALQAAASSESRPRLLRVQRGSGHGLGKPTSKLIDLDVDILAFLFGTIGTGLAPAEPANSAG